MVAVGFGGFLRHLDSAERLCSWRDCIETVAYEYLRYRARRRPVFTGGYRGWHRSDDRARLRSPDRGWHDPLSESWKKHIQNHRPGAGNTEWLCIFGVRMQDL